MYLHFYMLKAFFGSAFPFDVSFKLANLNEGFYISQANADLFFAVSVF